MWRVRQIMFSVPVCYSICNWAIPEKNKLREGEGVEDIPFCNPLDLLSFFTLSLEIPEKTSFYPQELHKIALHPSEIWRPNTKSLEIPHEFFLIAPGNSTCPHLSLPPPHCLFFSGITDW